MPYIRFLSAILIVLFCPLKPLSLSAQEFLIPDNPLKGRFIFEQKGCINCHSIEGDGGDIGPDLGYKKFYGSLLQLASIMWNHSPEMLRRMRELDLPYPEFSRTEMVELIAFLYYLRYLDEPGDLYRGKIVLQDKGCLTCHSIGGKGGKGAPAFDKLSRYVSPLYLAQTLWNHSPEMQKKLKKMGLGRPKFEKGEIVDLSVYIRSASNVAERKQVYMSPGNPNQGRKILEEKGCLYCHTLNSAEYSIGPNFAEMEWSYSVTEIAGLMWNHGSEMSELMEEHEIIWPMFKGREMADLISYLYFLGFKDKPGNPKTGKKLFTEKNCVQCHGAGGKGGEYAPDLSEAKALSSATDLAQVMWNHAPVMEEKIAAKIIHWPDFAENEMTDLYSYLRTLSGTDIPENKK